MKLEILKPIDHLIETQLESLQENPQFQSALDNFTSLDDHIQKIVKISLSILLISVPLIFVLFLTKMNGSLKDEVKNKETMLRVSQKIIAQQVNINSIKNQFIGKSYIENQAQMSDLLAGTVGGAGVSLSNLTINNFSLIEDNASTPEVRFELNFSALSNKQLFEMIKILSTNTNMRFSDISIQKNNSTNLLDGVLTTHYYSEFTSPDGEGDE